MNISLNKFKVRAGLLARRFFSDSVKFASEQRKLLTRILTPTIWRKLANLDLVSLHNYFASKNQVLTIWEENFGMVVFLLNMGNSSKWKLKLRWLIHPTLWHLQNIYLCILIIPVEFASCMLHKGKLKRKIRNRIVTLCQIFAIWSIISFDDAF